MINNIKFHFYLSLFCHDGSIKSLSHSIHIYIRIYRYISTRLYYYPLMLIIHGYSSSIRLCTWMISMDGYYPWIMCSWIRENNDQDFIYKQFDVPISCIYIHSAAKLRHRHRAKNKVTK